MPSFLDKHCSEPVSLASDDSSPYEPPHRKSQEKSWYYGARPIGSFSEATNHGGLPNGRKTEGSQFQLVDATPQNLQTLPNGRSSISSDRLAKLHSKNDSNHSLLANPSNNHEHSTDIDRASSNTLKTTKVDPITTNMEATATHPAKLESPLPIRKSQDGPSRRSGHARGHSLSAPQSPNSRLLHDKTTEPAQGTFRGETGLPTGRKESYSGSRFSSPPILPQSPPTAPNSTDSLAHPGAVRLQHRHTLQVPRLATGRSSRDFSLPIGSSSDDPSTDPDRSSPTHATRGSTSLARRPTRSIHSDMYLDEIPQDDDMARWTEIIRQKRASRRRRKDEEEDDRVVVGTKVDMHHVNWVTAYNMLTGIRFTVSRTNAKIDRDLTDADFDARHKFSFDM